MALGLRTVHNGYCLDHISADLLIGGLHRDLPSNEPEHLRWRPFFTVPLSPPSNFDVSPTKYQTLHQLNGSASGGFVVCGATHQELHGQSFRSTMTMYHHQHRTLRTSPSPAQQGRSLPRYRMRDNNLVASRRDTYRHHAFFPL